MAVGEIEGMPMRLQGFEGKKACDAGHRCNKHEDGLDGDTPL